MARNTKTADEAPVDVPEDEEEVNQEDVEGELNAMLADSAEEGADLADDEVEIDLSEAESFEPFTATVPVEVVAAVLKHGKTSKKPYVELKLRVFEGDYEKRILWTNINLTGKGAGFATDKLRALGLDFDPKHPRIKLKGLVGRRCNVACAPDEREEYSHKVVVGKFTRYVSAAEESAADLK
jgi:hypothetical protein